MHVEEEEACRREVEYNFKRTLPDQRTAPCPFTYRDTQPRSGSAVQRSPFSSSDLTDHTSLHVTRIKNRSVGLASFFLLRWSAWRPRARLRIGLTRQGEVEADSRGRPAGMYGAQTNKQDLLPLIH